MKLKYLFNNEDLALMCLKKWTFDQDSTVLFKYFRISSNAIYPFKHNGQLQFLRFSPAEEKSYKALEGEVQLLKHLLKNDVQVPELIPSIDGHLIESIKTPWGQYYAMVFQGIVSDNGYSMEEASIDETVIYSLGSILANIHKNSEKLSQDTCYRPSILDQLKWIQSILKEYSDDTTLLDRTHSLIKSLEDFPRGKDVYGLLHYDFELDNLMMDKDSGTIYTIDFDDACYGWYQLDILIAIDNIIEESDFTDYDLVRSTFLEGYQSVRAYVPLSDDHVKELMRFQMLYKYAGILRTTAEKWENEPEWMVGLREKLDSVKVKLLHQLLN